MVFNHLAWSGVSREKTLGTIVTIAIRAFYLMILNRKKMWHQCPPSFFKRSSFRNSYAMLWRLQLPSSYFLFLDAGVLKVVHLLGKSGNNAFTPAPKLDDLVKAEEADSDVDPRRNFKKELVRLVGNMSHRSRANQDLVGLVDVLSKVVKKRGKPFH